VAINIGGDVVEFTMAMEIRCYFDPQKAFFKDFKEGQEVNIHFYEHADGTLVLTSIDIKPTS